MAKKSTRLEPIQAVFFLDSRALNQFLHERYDG